MVYIVKTGMPSVFRKDLQSGKTSWRVRWYGNTGKRLTRTFYSEEEKDDFVLEKKRKRETERPMVARLANESKRKKPNMFAIEAEGIKLIAPYVQNIFAVRDGAKADLVLKTGDSEYKGIQIKTTRSRNSHGCAQFYHVSGYNGLVVVCILIDEKRCWVFRGEEMTQVKSIAIGKLKSKYNGHEVPLEDLQSCIESTLSTYESKSFEYWNTYGLATKTLLEHVAHALFCKTTGTIVTSKCMGDLEHSVVDFMLGEDRIQEKVAYKINRHFKVNISKSAGINSNQPYHVDDVDRFHIYIMKYSTGWYHQNDRNAIQNANLIGYFSIPSHDLVKHGFLSTDGTVGKTSISVFLPIEVAKKHNLSLPANDVIRCDSSAWTRDYFVEC